MEQPEWMRHGWLAYGEKEIPGRRDNGDILQFYADVGHGGVAHDEVAWCAAFLGSCLERAGEKSTRSLMARSYLKWGEPLAEPQLGAIAVLSRGANQALGHVGFVVRADEQALYLLGGNQSNQVKISRFDRSRLLGFRWPVSGQVATANGRGEGGELAGMSDPGNRVPVSNDKGKIQVKVKAGADGEADGDQKANLEAKYSAKEKVKARRETALFKTALSHVLAMEGGYSDDPYDPGGATNFGITIGDFARARNVILSERNLAKLKRQLRVIKPAEVRRIYAKRYWRRASCGALPAPLAIMHFDCAVNQGVGRAIPYLQKAVGAQVDGEIGPLTIGAAERACVSTASIKATLKNYADLRRRHYRGLGHFWRFGRGWLRRLDKTLDVAAAQISAFLQQRDGQNIASENQTLERTVTQRRLSSIMKKEAIKAAAIKAKPVKAKAVQKPALKPAQISAAKVSHKTTLPTKWWGESMTIWGTILTAASTILPILGPLVGLELTPELVQELGEQVIQLIKVIGGVAGLVMTIYGRSRASHRLVRREVKLMM